MYKYEALLLVGLIIAPIYGMEIAPLWEIIKAQTDTQQKYYDMAHQEFALPWTIAPVELVDAMDNDRKIRYEYIASLEGSSSLKKIPFVLPYSCVLTPHTEEGEKIFMLIDPAKKRTHFFTCSETHCPVTFDGLNNDNRGLLVCQNNDYKRYFLYTLTQYKDSICVQEKKEPLLTGEGVLESVMLDPVRNRFMYSVKKEESCALYIKDFGNGACKDVAELITDVLFFKTVSLGKDTYLGITTTGDLYSIWLMPDNTIHYAQQKFLTNPKKFKDISVDNTQCTRTGFRQKIALLTETGDIYITHLGAFEKPTLLYVTTALGAVIKRLYYHDGKLIVIYKGKINKESYSTVLLMLDKQKGNRGPIVTEVDEWQDNFEILYFCALLKHLHQSSCVSTLLENIKIA